MRTATFCALGGAFILSLGLIAAGSTATFANKMTSVSASAPQTVVDRSNKGDRLAVNSTVIRKAPTEAYNAPVKQEQQSQSRRLLDGCDPLVSPLAGSATAGLTGRCMS